MTSTTTYPNTYTPYFYIIEHIPTGVRYAGCKFGKDSNPSKFMQPKGYQTSSAPVHRLILADGLKSFRIVTLLTEQDCGEGTVYEYETRFLQDHNIAADPLWLNKHNNTIHTTGTDRFKQIMLAITGYDHPMKNPATRQKVQETNMDKRGFVSNLADPLAREQWEQRRLLRTGKRHQMQLDEVKSKQVSTMLSRHGVPHNFCNGTLRIHTADEYEAKYGSGVRNIAQVPGFITQKEDKFEAKFGVRNPMHLQSTIDIKRAQVAEKQARSVVAIIRQYLTERGVRPIDVGLSRQWFSQSTELLNQFCITHQLSL